MSPSSSAPITAVVAVAENDVIGVGPDIPWQIPGEQRRFKELTMGGVLVMGRKTFESIGRPLPGRRTLVVTRDKQWGHEGVEVVDSVEGALVLAKATGQPVFVAGGGEVYRAAMPHVEAIEMTRVHSRPEGDVTFPSLGSEWVEVSRIAADTHSYVRLIHRTGQIHTTGSAE